MDLLFILKTNIALKSIYSVKTNLINFRFFFLNNKGLHIKF